MDKDYVIGLSPNNLINVELGFDFNSSDFVIRKLTHNIESICNGATMIYGLNNAIKLLNEIQNNYNNIIVENDSIISSIIDGKSIDPMKLNIYEITVGDMVNIKEIEVE